ncbi:MAG: hypothetical protein DDT20_00849 [Firmicutes bacterium]|nr:hypothetical protein [Bacillota bacterium]
MEHESEFVEIIYTRYQTGAVVLTIRPAEKDTWSAIGYITARDGREDVEAKEVVKPCYSLRREPTW